MFILFIFAALCMIHLYQCLRLRNRPPLIEGAWPIIGHSLKVAKDLQYLLETETPKLYKKGIDIGTLRLGVFDIYVFENPEDCQIVSSCIQKDSFYDILKPYLGEGLVTSSGHTWVTRRRLMCTLFNQQILNDFMIEFNNGAKEVVCEMREHVGMGPFDHFLLVEETTFVSICAIVIGPYHDENDKQSYKNFRTARNQYKNCIIQRITKFWYHVDFIYNLSGLKNRLEIYLKEMNQVTRKIFDKKISEYKSNKNLSEDKTNYKYNSLMDYLLRLVADGKLTDEDVFNEVRTSITAASDTLPVALTTVLLCVGTYPQVQQKIWEELQSVFGDSDRDVEKDDLYNLKYLEAVLNETLRLYPPIPITGKCLEKDLKIRNYTFPTGSKCYISVYGLLRHPSWGPDADQFRPERWLDGSVPSAYRVHAAFGNGKRRCIGANFSMMALKVYASWIFRKYSIFGDVTSMRRVYQILSEPVGSHHISIELRNSGNK